MNSGVSVVAFPGQEGEDAFVALRVARGQIQKVLDADPRAEVLIRIKTPEGFHNLLMELMGAAVEAWPEIAQEWADEMGGTEE